MKFVFLMALTLVSGGQHCWGPSGGIDELPVRSGLAARLPRESPPPPPAQPEPTNTVVAVSNHTYAGYVTIAPTVASAAVAAAGMIGSHRVVAFRRGALPQAAATQ
jgi:hypothetical protein